jgi:hypothetical protein
VPPLPPTALPSSSSSAVARPPICVQDAVAEDDHAPAEEGGAEGRARFIQALAALAEGATAPHA